MKINIDPMVHLRKRAVEKVDAHYNRLAQSSLHDDMLALAAGRGENHPVHARHGAKLVLLSQVTCARTPEELTGLLERHDIDPGQ